MAYIVTSWFIDQLNSPISTPKRVFKIATSDYSDRITKWPNFKRTAMQFKSVNISMPMANADGGLNHFYAGTYTIPNTATVEIGFTHTQSGDELIRIFTGRIKNVRYSNKICSVQLRDRLFDFSNIKIGDTDNSIIFSNQLPSDIAWTLCTCYGGLDSTQGKNNVDINYDSFLEWAAVFSGDGLFCDARYSSLKITEALSRLSKMTDSAIWIEGNGKITFKRFTEADTNDIVLTRDQLINININIETSELINKQHVGFGYSVDSDYWEHNVFYQNSTSVNTFGLYEQKIEDDSIWYISSASAMNLAQRRVSLYSDPPRKFKLLTSMVGIHRQLGETVRIVDSFYNQTSEYAWRIIDYQFDMDKGNINYLADKSSVLLAFTLDVSTLDNQTEVLI